MPDTPDVIAVAQRTLLAERDALTKLIRAIDSDFEQAVHVIYESKGRVVVTGIGKSAIIAQKIVATLNSTGTPALFMHAADAVHGDLGMVCSDDVVLCISKSGDTPEIKVLVPMLRTFGSRLIGMVARRSSYLGQQADYVLHTPVSREADPNNLAPTTSTVVQMAMGDALAVALLSLRGFTPRDFAQFHPGGALGKQLYLKASDLYPNNERPAVSTDTHLRQVIVEISSRRLGCTAVLDERQQVVGIITDGDVRRLLDRLADLEAVTATDMMSASPRTILPELPAVQALHLMREYNISQLLVVDKQGEYLGVIHLHDLVREGIV